MALAFCLALILPAPARAELTFPLDVHWSRALPAPPAYPPAYSDAHIYVATRAGQLIALALIDGEPVWSVECPMDTAPAAGDGLVLAGSDGLIEARRQADGRTQWRTPVPGKVTQLYWNGGWLIASLEAGGLLALRAVDGEVLWQRDYGSPLSAPPGVSGEQLYLPLKDGRLLALVLQTGEPRWTYPLAEPAVGILPVGDRVFLGARDNQFQSLDAGNGGRDWRYPTGADVVGLPVLDARRVYFLALDNVLRGHDRGNGNMNWKVVLPFRPFTGPVLTGDTLVVAGIASELRAYSARDGQPIGEFVVKGAENEEVLLAAPPHLTGDGRVVLITKGGQVRGIGTAKPADPAPDAPPASDAPASPDAPADVPAESPPPAPTTEP